MKEVIAASTIFLVIISLSVISSVYTDNIAEKLTDLTHNCEKDIQEEKWVDAKLSIKEARECFIENSHALESFLLHDDIERLSDILTNIEISVELRDRSQSLSNIKIFTRRLHELAESDKLTLNNIL